jgi:CRISPR system Cascade subunit CasC
MNNPFKGVVIEYHILQSFPVTCLNRDDVGAPKTAIVGGTTRARVSSQSWKRAVRMKLQEFGVKLAIRSKKIEWLISQECLKRGASKDKAEECGKVVSEAIAKDTLFFFTESEAKSYVDYLQKIDFTVNPKEVLKEISKISKATVLKAADGLDIALFGRMVAQDTEMNVEGAAAFAHAISTHKVVNEVEFFTALDDWEETQASAHMGSLEYNSGIYYRYVSLNLGQLYENLYGENISKAIDVFTKALYSAIPAARQATMSGASFWDYARIYLRKGQRLQVPFDEAVKGSELLKRSIEALKKYLEKKEEQAASLFGKISEYTLADDTDLTIDSLVENLNKDLTEILG